MFSRKRIETEDRKMADASDDLGIPMKPARPMGPGAGPGANSGAGPANPGPNGPAKPPTMPPRSPDLARAGETMAIRPAEPIRRPGDPTAQPRRNDGEVRKLTVGREITLSGEITSCDKLIIEGSVEANLNNCRDVEIAESGLFKGSAAIEEAESLLRTASRSNAPGRFQLEAAVQSVHAARRRTGRTDWEAIAALYEALHVLTGSPVVAVNRAVAVAQTQGSAAGLALLEQDAPSGGLAGFEPYWVAKAELSARTGHRVEARRAYEVAIGLQTDPAARVFLVERLQRLG